MNNLFLLFYSPKPRSQVIYINWPIVNKPRRRAALVNNLFLNLLSHGNRITNISNVSQHFCMFLVLSMSHERFQFLIQKIKLVGETLAWQLGELKQTPTVTKATKTSPNKKN